MLRLWPVAFAVLALFFAVQYLGDGFADGGARADRIKGFVWIALALFVVLLEYLRRWKSRRDEAS
jgi:hypothetical protein